MDSNQRFLLKSFRKYYKEESPILPERFTRREFGFMFFDKTFVQRHIGFSRPDDLKRFMIGQVPSHSYYSTAYYRHPDAPTMEEKEWLGAELIFDLDADHLDGAANMSYDEMLRQIRSEMMNLVDKFIYGDLGFSEKDVYLTFSGGRGYHAHIPHKDVVTLGTHERRELVDYITCSGLNIDWIFPLNSVATTETIINGAVRRNIVQDRMIPAEDSGGWKLKMRHGLQEVVEDFCTMDSKSLKKTYPSISKSATKTIDTLCADIKESRNIMFVKNNMATLNKHAQDTLVKIMKEDVAHRLAGEVDEPVTADIKRLIRLPGSVHGKSGLRVTPISRDELTTFNPLENAVPAAYSDDPTKITLRRPYELNMKGETFKLEGETEVPEYAAIFLIGRKVADIGYASEKKDLLF